VLLCHCLIRWSPSEPRGVTFPPRRNLMFRFNDPSQFPQSLYYTIDLGLGARHTTNNPVAGGNF